MSDSEPDTQVALWFWRYYTPDFDLFDSEEEAAVAGVYMEDSGNASVAGIQFPDGRTIARNEWPAWSTATDQMLQAEREANAKRATEPPRPTRKVRAPFSDGRVIEIDASEPPWVGKPA